MRNDGITECAGHSSNPTSGSFRNKPDTIFIKSNAANKERWMVTKVIMHELGHALGLDNSKTTTSCGAGDIMGLVTKTADCLERVVNFSALFAAICFRLLPSSIVISLIYGTKGLSD
jgi:hypothetical protein